MLNETTTARIQMMAIYLMSANKNSHDYALDEVDIV